GACAPVPVAVALHQDAVVVPAAGLELAQGELPYDPGLALGVDDDALAGVGQDAPAALLVEHAVVIGPVGHDVALVAGDDGIAQVGARRAAVVEAAVAARADPYPHAQLEVLDRAAAPDQEAVVLQLA